MKYLSVDLTFGQVDVYKGIFHFSTGGRSPRLLTGGAAAAVPVREVASRVCRVSGDSPD